MQFIDLGIQQNRIREKIENNIRRTLDHGKYIMGPEVRTLEERLGQYAGTEHAIACASGTDALLMALMAYGIGPGDAIFTSPFTFIATAEVISLLGATPIFVDVDPETFNMQPGKLELAIQALKTRDRKIYPLPSNTGQELSKLTPKGIVAVDLFGIPADYGSINVIARQNHLFVIEDAAQSFGAEYKGKMSCSLADVGCTSFFPAKPLGCYGDGGMCFTNNDDIAALMKSIRVHGKGTHKYDNTRIGINGRLDTIQASILLAKFEIFPEEVELRQKVAGRYATLLNGAGSVNIPGVPEKLKSVCAQYSLLAEDENRRSQLQDKLKRNEVPTAIYYPRPLHLQPAFSNLGYLEGDFPISEDCSRRIFSIPMHPYLREAEQRKIAELIDNI
jgi:dTDP-4-amino-4,6-dideoxygalactose transaminase